MERESIELKRFEQKADGYVKALSLAPNARIFEIIAILNVINDFVSKSDINKSKIRIVELMAGSGYLTSFLKRNDFKNIHVFEISTDMSKHIKSEGVNFYPITNLLEVEEHLKKIKPHIIVSLAGYHHLMTYNTGEEIDFNQSYEYQIKITDISLKYVDNSHLILIADIFESELLNEVQYEPIYWNTDAFEIIPKRIFPKDLINSIKQSKDLKNYSDILRDNYSNPLVAKNSTITWFRDVVEGYTVPGHKDVAISKTFIDKLSGKYSVYYSTFYTPWIFKDKKQLADFIHSFWFTEFKMGKTFEDIEKYIEKKHLTKSLDDGAYSFNWELAIVTVQKTDCIKYDNYYKKGIVYLIVLILILIFAAYIKKETFYFDVTYVLDKLIWIIYAIIIKEIIVEKLKTLWLTKTSANDG